MTVQSCWGCHRVKEIAHTDVLARRFCVDCLKISGMQGETAARAFLAVTVPFEKGDRVESRLAGTRYEGRGVITTVSMELKDGGTPVNPIFHIAFEPDSPGGITEAWRCEGDLQRVS